MITIRNAVSEDIPQLKDLWRKCFGDPSAYVDIFFQRFCDLDQVLVVDDDGEVDSMIAMLPGSLILPEEGEIPVAYAYALATNPYMQGKGHARQLLKYADTFVQQRGDKATVLVPASPSLHRFFEAVGYEECFATRKVEFLTSALTGETGGGVMTPISPQEYNQIREGYLKNSYHMNYTDQMITFQQIGSHLAYGDLYKLEVDGAVGCVAIEYVQKRRLLAKELLIPVDKMSYAVETIAKEMEASRYHIRTPAFWEGLPGSYCQAFGMIKWYDNALAGKYMNKQDAYLGLGFD